MMVGDKKRHKQNNNCDTIEMEINSIANGPPFNMTLHEKEI